MSVKAVCGFQTKDGVFHESLQKAEEHEFNQTVTNLIEAKFEQKPYSSHDCWKYSSYFRTVLRYLETLGYKLIKVDDERS